MEARCSKCDNILTSLEFRNAGNVNMDGFYCPVCRALLTTIQEKAREILDPPKPKSKVVQIPGCPEGVIGMPITQKQVKNFMKNEEMMGQWQFVQIPGRKGSGEDVWIGVVHPHTWMDIQRHIDDDDLEDQKERK